MKRGADMRYFDLHCDTITECWHRNLSLKTNTLQVGLDRADRFEAYAQCYAVWIPDELRGEKAFQRFQQVTQRFYNELEQVKELARPCTTPAERVDSCSEKKHCAILTVENASVLGGNLEKVRTLAESGVKLCTLTWNGENELGRGARAPGLTGLTTFGKQAVKEMERSGIIADVSHASPELFWDVIKIAAQPVVASHSNAKSLCDHPRNLTDEQFKAIRDSGGLVGLNLVSFFLRDKPEQASSDDILRHAEHFLNLGGENALAIGSDWDGSAPEDFPLSGIQEIPALYECFRNNGFGQEITDKIFFRNADDFFHQENLL